MVNVELIKYLVELSDGTVDVINTKALFDVYPEESIHDDLCQMKNLGYLTISYGDNRIDTIGVNQRAIDYVNKL